jgi:hypothetical protein
VALGPDFDGCKLPVSNRLDALERAPESAAEPMV